LIFRSPETWNRFLRRGAGQARGHGSPKSRGDLIVAVRVRGSTSLVGLIWVIVGIVVAWMHDYITVDLLRRVIAAVLAILLWFLVLLGVNLHLH
jgi:hypothetical protein